MWFMEMPFWVIECFLEKAQRLFHFLSVGIGKQTDIHLHCRQAVIFLMGEISFGATEEIAPAHEAVWQIYSFC